MKTSASESGFTCHLAKPSAAAFFVRLCVFFPVIKCFFCVCTQFPIRTHRQPQRDGVVAAGRVTCVDTLSLLLSPEQLHSSSGGLSTLLRGLSIVAAEGQAVCDTFSVHTVPAGIRIQNSNMVAKLSCSHCNT